MSRLTPPRRSVYLAFSVGNSDAAILSEFKSQLGYARVRAYRRETVLLQMGVPCFPSLEFTNCQTADNRSGGGGGDDDDDDDDDNDDDDDDNDNDQVGGDDDDSVRTRGARFRHRRESGTAN